MKHTLLSLLLVLTTSIHFSEDSKISVPQDDLMLKQQRVALKLDSINMAYDLDYTDTVNFEREDWWSFCSVYWEKKRALIDLQKEYFDAFYLKPYLVKEIPEVNKAILKVLSNELGKSFKEKYSDSYAIEAPFFAILHLIENLSGVYVPEYIAETIVDGKKSYLPIGKEPSLQKPFKNNEEYFAYLSSNQSFRFNPGVLDTIPFFIHTQFNGYNGSIRTSVEVMNFGAAVSECDTEYFYHLNAQKELKIGSRHQFELVPFHSPKINERINQPICYDCPVSKNFEVFAKFKGIEGLFFAYSKEGHTPGAELIMQMKDQYVSIWSNTSDQFGCACL